jgi:hypothetical protein
MRTVLLTLGDSWPEGAELGLGLRYGEILRDRFDYDEFYNYGVGGASNEDMLYQLQHYIANHHSVDNVVTAIFFLTNPARTAHMPRSVSLDTTSDERKHWPPDAKQFVRDLFLHLHTPKHEIMRSTATVTALQTWCSRHHIQDYYFSGWVKYPVWLPGVDLAKIWAQGTETATDWFGASSHNGEHLINVTDNIYIKPNFAHPNQLGHQLIADRLASWIR